MVLADQSRMKWRQDTRPGPPDPRNRSIGIGGWPAVRGVVGVFVLLSKMVWAESRQDT